MPPNVGSSAATTSMKRCRVARVELEVVDVDVGEVLEQAGLALHHRLAGERADVAEAQHRGAVGDDRDQVAARRVLPGELRVLRDLQARLGDAGRIRERQVALGDQRLGRDDLDLPGPPSAVVVERVVSTDHLARTSNTNQRRTRTTRVPESESCHPGSSRRQHENGSNGMKRATDRPRIRESAACRRRTGRPHPGDELADRPPEQHSRVRSDPLTIAEITASSVGRPRPPELIASGTRIPPRTIPRFDR